MTGSQQADPLTADLPAADRRGILGWLSYQCALQPVQSVIMSFVFAPYFASRIAQDGVAGQSLWGLVTAAAGMIIALASPLLGAVADRGGAVKPWLATLSLAIVLGCVTLLLAAPGGDPRIAVVLSAIVLIAICSDFASVLGNTLMTRLAPRAQLGRLSGWGFAAGFLGGVVALLVLLLTNTPPVWSGPFVALWHVLFALPLFLLAPDRRHTGTHLAGAVGRTLRSLGAVLAEVRQHRQLLVFLAANMAYKDGIAAVAAFGGIYAAAVFDWPAQTIGLYGVLLIVAAAIGAFVGGSLDHRLGSWSLCLGALGLFILASVGLLSVEPDRILFWIVVEPPQPGGGLFASAAEMGYVVFGLLLGASGGPIFASSRSMLGQMAPQDRMTQYFGLFAFSSRATVFTGPLLVGIVTAWTGSQRVGLASILVLLMIGLALLARVGPPRAMVEGEAAS